MTNDDRLLRQTACAAGTLRRASRSLTRLYDAHLACTGLTTTQFSILRTIQRRGGCMTLAELASVLVFERTSLYRALVPLRRARLLIIKTSADRRAKDVALTPRANRRIAAATPHWAAAQRVVLDRFGSEDWPVFAARLGDLAGIARAAPAI